jgi:hypothetical protein
MKPIPPREAVRIKDALHNCSPQSGASTEYGRGVLVAVVSCLTAYGYTCMDAIKLAREWMPADTPSYIWPEGWK